MPLALERLIITLRPFCADWINLSSGSASLVLISLLRRFWSPSMRIARQQGGSDSRIAAVLRKSKSAFIGIFVLSAALNVLLLGGAIYMMMVYDVVLPAGSVPTLAGLLLLVILRSEEHTSELQSLMRISYAVFC